MKETINVIFSTKKPICQEEEKAEAIETNPFSTEEGLTQGKEAWVPTKIEAFQEAEEVAEKEVHQEANPEANPDSVFTSKKTGPLLDRTSTLYLERCAIYVCFHDLTLCTSITVNST